MISVVMPVYNGQKYLRDAIDSVVNQTYIDFEFIVVNDGSTDNSESIIKEYNDSRIKLFSIPNGGIANALNYGIKQSNRKYIARMDSDDICLPDRLEKQLEYLENHNDVVILGSSALVIDEDGDFVYKAKVLQGDSNIRSNLPATSFYHPSVMFRKDIFYKCGEYPKFMRRGEDAVLFARMLEFGKGENMEQALLKYRITSSSLSLRNKAYDSMLDGIVMNSYKNKALPTEESVQELESLVKNISEQERRFNYYIFLVKKYLWDNPQKRKVFRFINRSYGINPFNKELMLLTFIALLPNFLVKFLYSRFKTQ